VNGESTLEKEYTQAPEGEGEDDAVEDLVSYMLERGWMAKGERLAELALLGRSCDKDPLFDSGATLHFVPVEAESQLFNIKRGMKRVDTVNGPTTVTKKGSLDMQTVNGRGDKNRLHLNNVWVSPNLDETLVSGPRLAQEGYSVVLGSNRKGYITKAQVPDVPDKHKAGVLYLDGEDRVWRFLTSTDKERVVDKMEARAFFGKEKSKVLELTSAQLHQKFGGPGSSMQKLIGEAYGVKIVGGKTHEQAVADCKECPSAKAGKVDHPASNQLTQVEKWEALAFDKSGCLRKALYGGYWYGLVGIEQNTGYAFGILLKDGKAEPQVRFMRGCNNFLETQSGVKLKEIRDRGR